MWHDHTIDLGHKKKKKKNGRGNEGVVGQNLEKQVQPL